MAKTYERVCPVCGEKFITRHYAKRFCCADCVAEYEDIKGYMKTRLRKVVAYTIEQARTTNRLSEDLVREFIKKW